MKDVIVILNLLPWVIALFIWNLQYCETSEPNERSLGPSAVNIVKQVNLVKIVQLYC